jgi:hypothetical protein
MDEATRLFNKVFFALTGAWADTFSFRRIVLGGLPEAQHRLREQNAQWFGQYVDDPTNDAVFIDKPKYLETVGGVDAVAEVLTKQQIQAYGGSVDAASIVFMHSALNGALHDLCRATALAAPEQWQPFVDGQEERLGVLRERGYEEVVRERISAFLDALSYESLVKKTDRLFQVCRPDRAYARARYEFDRDRLVQWDDIRHDIIHRDRPRVPIQDVEAGIEFLHETGLFFFGMVNYRYGLRLDPAYAAERAADV